ncbi:Gfo/Idh/MocA family protein [Deinococcus sonorensis]
MSAEWLRCAERVEGLEVVGLVDLHEPAARARQQEFHLDHAVVSHDLDAVLQATRPDIVFDCTVPEAHHDTALTSFQHGVSVLGEKPLADTLPRARAMVQAAQDSGLLHAVVQNRRYNQNIRRVQQFVQSGQLGTLTTLNADFYIGAHFGGFRDQMEHVLLLDMAIHTFDAARLISGQNPLSVVCHEWNPPGSWYRQGASAVAIFELSGGVVFTYRGSWAAEGAPTSWEGDWRVVGTHGTIRWDGGDQPTASVVRRSGGFLSELEERELPPAAPGARTGGHEGVIRDAVRALRSGTEPETVSHDNLHSLAMVLAAIQSATEGRRVPVDGGS